MPAIILTERNNGLRTSQINRFELTECKRLFLVLSLAFLSFAIIAMLFSSTKIHFPICSALIPSTIGVLSAYTATFFTAILLIFIIALSIIVWMLYKQNSSIASIYHLEITVSLAICIAVCLLTSALFKYCNITVLHIPTALLILLGGISSLYLIVTSLYSFKTENAQFEERDLNPQEQIHIPQVDLTPEPETNDEFNVEERRRDPSSDETDEEEIRRRNRNRGRSRTKKRGHNSRKQ